MYAYAASELISGTNSISLEQLTNNTMQFSQNFTKKFNHLADEKVVESFNNQKRICTFAPPSPIDYPCSTLHLISDLASSLGVVIDLA